MRLDGPGEARVFQAMRVEEIDECHYHLVLDSTAVALATCVEVIVAAARAHQPA